MPLGGGGLIELVVLPSLLEFCKNLLHFESTVEDYIHMTLFLRILVHLKGEQSSITSVAYCPRTFPAYGFSLSLNKLTFRYIGLCPH